MYDLEYARLHHGHLSMHALDNPSLKVKKLSKSIWTADSDASCGNFEYHVYCIYIRSRETLEQNARQLYWALQTEYSAIYPKWTSPTKLSFGLHNVPQNLWFIHLQHKGVRIMAHGGNDLSIFVRIEDNRNSVSYSFSNVINYRAREPSSPLLWCKCHLWIDVGTATDKKLIPIQIITRLIFLRQQSHGP